ncbi:unnamed protein product [Urochloa decumbens]|uniref:Uncharacterized protein n=1 Tax=Urochloa decumbens TaxID=240449 RepID=A0ABC9FIS8_9POAL
MVHLGVHHLGNLLASRRHNDGAPHRTAAQGGHNAVPVAGIVIPNVVKSNQAPLIFKLLSYELMERAQLVALRARFCDRLSDLARHGDDVGLLGDPDPEHHVEVRPDGRHVEDVLHQHRLADTGHPDDGHHSIVLLAIGWRSNKGGDPLDVAVPPVEVLATGKCAARHERAHHGLGCAITVPEPELLPVRRDLLVPCPDAFDLAPEPSRWCSCEQQRRLAAPLPGRGGAEQVLLELLQLGGAAGLVLELLQDILGMVLQVTELGEPQLDGAVGDRQALGVVEHGADPLQLGLERRQLVVVDGGRLRRAPELLQEGSRELLGLDGEVEQRLTQRADDRFLCLVSHCRICERMQERNGRNGERGIGTDSSGQALTKTWVEELTRPLKKSSHMRVRH